jgi:hypothetical protein
LYNKIKATTTESNMKKLNEVLVWKHKRGFTKNVLGKFRHSERDDTVREIAGRLNEYETVMYELRLFGYHNSRCSTGQYTEVLGKLI